MTPGFQALTLLHGMHLTPLTQATSRGPAARPLLPMGSFFKQTQGTIAQCPSEPGPANSSLDIHKLLEKHSRQITQTGKSTLLQQASSALPHDHHRVKLRSDMHATGVLKWIITNVLCITVLAVCRGPDSGHTPVTTAGESGMACAPSSPLDTYHQPAVCSTTSSAGVYQLQDYANDLQALHVARAEAQQADDASAVLAAEVHQLQLEITAKLVSA